MCVWLRDMSAKKDKSSKSDKGGDKDAIKPEKFTPPLDTSSWPILLKVRCAAVPASRCADVRAELRQAARAHGALHAHPHGPHAAEAPH